MLIKDLYHEEKPREKLLYKDSTALSDVDLLAIILRSGTRNLSAVELARKLLVDFTDLKSLFQASLEDLIKYPGIGKVKALTLKAVWEMLTRLSSSSGVRPIFIKDPHDVYEVVKSKIYAKSTEHLFLLSLDARRQVTALDLISVGTVNEALIDVREIYVKALSRNAVSIILIHNHPSQNTDPSNEDIDVTHKVSKAGLLLHLPLIDHVIVSDTSYTSLRAHGLIINSQKGGDSNV